MGHKFSVLTAAHNLSFSTGAYSSLESIGVHIVQSDSLRQSLVTLFTSSIPYLEYTYQNNRENVLNFGRPLLRSEFTHELTYIPVDFEKLKQGVLLHNVLKSIRGNNYSIIQALEGVMKEIEIVVDLINSELSEL